LVKFKTIYILFNAVILVSFALIFFLPLIMLGPEYFSIFVSRNWIAGMLFLATLVIINVYFLRNWRLFRLLEQEDWPALIQLLEDRVYRRKRLMRNNIKMLVNAYLITSRLGEILSLSAFVEQNRPELIKRFALPFGIPYLLQNDPKAAERFFGKFRQVKGATDYHWLVWNYAFALLQQKQVEAARTALLDVLDQEPEPVLRLLTLYMLDSVSGKDDEYGSLIETGRGELTRRYTPESWGRAVDSASKNLEVVLLAPIVRDASAWLFPKTGMGSAVGDGA
jgi:hypothetical protein